MKILFITPKHFFLEPVFKILLVSVIISVSPLNAQTLRDVKIKTNNESVTLEQVLKLIEQNTKFAFTYNRETVPLERKIQLTEGEETLYQVLYNLAKHYGLTFHRISNQIVMKKAEGNEKNLVTDEENNTIEGKVIDAKTNEPLAFVSVYLSGTTIGTTTNIEGMYKIKSVPHGKYNLVASIVGHEPKIVEIELRNEAKLTLDFPLVQKIINYKQVEINAEMPEKWKAQLKYFKKLFLGDNRFAEDCIIKNEYKLDFQEDNSVFTVSINEPIKVLNNALGYKLDCVLKKFLVDKKRNKFIYQIYPVFTEITPSTQDSIEDFIFNRKDAYDGSLMHLLSSLTVNNYSFRNEGFQLRVPGRLWWVTKPGDIISIDTLTNKYYLNFKGRLQIFFRGNNGKRAASILLLDERTTEFDPAGYLINPEDFTLYGEMAKEGVATMLPRFWKPEEDKR